MSDKGYKKYFTEQGEFVAMGNRLSFSDLYAIYGHVDIANMKPEFLPNENMIKGTPTERKNFAFKLAESIWGLTPNDWLRMENNWLFESRIITGSQEVGGKDQLSDVVSVEILLGLISAAKLATENRDGSSLCAEALLAINAILTEACAKGRARMEKTEGKTVYSVLKRNGLMIGLGGGKYLPYPKKSLPVLFLMLNNDHILSTVYQD